MDAANKLALAALAYARAGWRIFPLGRRSKLPAIAKAEGGRGFLDATTDERTVRAWWERFPEANIGFATGDGVLVIDIDAGAHKKGPDTFDSLQHKFGVLPATRECLTGGGGRQIYCRVPAGLENVAQLGPDVDLKGTGGYVVLPPSVHPRTKREYIWDGLEGFNAPIAELPATWLAACRRRERVVVAMEAPDASLANLKRIEKNCAWIRHCKTDAAALGEPEWFALLTILARTQSGRKDAHKYSEAYPRYSRAETEKKFEHAKEALGPATCERIARELGGEEKYCAACPHWQKIQSPINTAYLKQERAPVAPIAAGDNRGPANGATPQNAPPDEESWRDHLQRNQRGRPYANLYNAAVAFVRHPDASGVLGFDEFREKVWIRKRLGAIVHPGELDERRSLALAGWLQAELNPQLSEQVARSAVELAARSRPFHPVREWLTSLVWDGAIRLREGFFERYFHARRVAFHLSAVDQAVYWNEVACIFLISAVARIIRPGCQADNMLVLEGASGSLKSKALEALAGGRSLFVNQLPRLDYQTLAAEAIRGKWFVEVADLGALLQYESARQFLTKREDQITPAHNKRLGKIATARQCVFVASTSERRYLWDEAAQRYILPIAAGEIDLEALVADREQLFAEAFTLYRQGTPWYPSPQLSAIYRREQEVRLIDDPWAQRVRDYLIVNPQITVADVLTKNEVPFFQMDRKMTQRVERILWREGWRQEYDRETGELYWKNPRAPERKVLQ